PDLADLLEALARGRSAEPFYRGDVARRIAAAFKKHGGLVTADDLAAYRAREVRPLELVWGGYSVRTPPPTAGGLTVLEALALMHGGSFGACVTVAGLGLTLGHGMSRFDPRPGHPNAPGPGKRPLHNMCPTVVLKDGRPVLALGGRGGRKIPNAVFEVLVHFV